MTGRIGRRVGLGILAVFAAMALLAPVIAPNDPSDQFGDRAYAPPSRIRIRDAAGLRAPFIYKHVLEDRVLRIYREEPASPVALRWFAGGRLVSTASDNPLLLLGADALGRDLFSRLVFGARLSLGVVLLGTIGAIVLGTLIGGVAGSLGGGLEAVLMRVADFVLVLPGAYLILALRGVLPQVMSASEVFVLMSALFAVAAWPHVARGVRAIVAVERVRDYADAARAAGAGPFRLVRHLLPAARGFLAVEIVLLVPALLVAEATVSYLGLGFPEPDASWGTMLQDAANVRVMAEAPWMLAPAAALFLVVLGVQLLGSTRASATVLRLGDTRFPLTAATARR
ncbi:MAG: ABC transporter permease [Acidobacteriota bacterium]